MRINSVQTNVPNYETGDLIKYSVFHKFIKLVHIHVLKLRTLDILQMDTFNKLLSFVQRLIITSLRPVNLGRCKFFFFASFWLVLNNSQRVQSVLTQTALWSVLFFLTVEKIFLQWALLWGRQSIPHITCDRNCSCWCFLPISTHHWSTPTRLYKPTIDPHDYEHFHSFKSVHWYNVNCSMMESTIANGGISAGNLLIKYRRLLLKHKDQWSGFVTSVAMRYGSS